METLISVSFFLLRYVTFLEVNVILFNGLSHHKELSWNIAYCSPKIGPYSPCFILVNIIACILWILALLYVTYAHACLNCGHPFRFMKSQRCLIKKSSIFSNVPYKLFNVLELILVYLFISYIWHLCWKMCSNFMVFLQCITIVKYLRHWLSGITEHI